MRTVVIMLQSMIVSFLALRAGVTNLVDLSAIALSVTLMTIAYSEAPRL